MLLHKKCLITNLAILFLLMFNGHAESLASSETELLHNSTYDNWDVLNPPFKRQSININTQETTWSSLDVAPNGQRFVFDMLGDIFIADIKGGNASALTQDFAWNIHPTISPNGKEVAFISDRDGLLNLWIMDIDGQNLKQVTSETKHTIHSPKWSPDGEYLVVTKGIMSSRSIPAGEIWLYHKTGGTGLAIKERVHGDKDQKNIADPSFSPDGKYIYYTQDITNGHAFQYNRDPLKSIFAITRYDRETGEEQRLISGTGGAIVPTPSPDGEKIAFIRRVKSKTVLFIKHIKTGVEEPIFFELERDMQEGFGSEGYFAYFDWLPNSTDIMFWTGGKFHTISTESKVLKTVNLSIKTKVEFAEALRFDVDVAPDSFNVKAIRWSQKSPDGNTILFQALGKLYLHDIKSGKSTRLTKQDNHDEFYPRYSNDGKKIVYTTWNDQALGSIKIVSSRGGKGKTVNVQSGHFIEPSFSNDGNFITYRKFTGGYLLDPIYSIDPGLYLLNLESKANIRISNFGFEPHFGANNDRIYFTENIGGTNYPETQFVSVNKNGEDKKVHLYGKDEVSEYRLSPNGKWVAFVYQFNTYVVPFAYNGKKITISPTMSSLPVRQLSARSGEYISWDQQSNSIGWFSGPFYYERTLDDAFDFNTKPENRKPAIESGLNLSFDFESAKPKNHFALVGATLVTMRNANTQQEVIKNGVIIVQDNIISAVGSNEQIKLPNGIDIVDVQGKTIIPGLIDTHAHGAQGRNEIIPQQNWGQFSNLAFGVTTIHDPSNDTTEIMAASELQKAGKIIAPRIYSTGTILYGAEALGYKSIINNYDDAFYHVQRLKDVGAISIKSYNQPRRDQRQQILVAAREQKMMVMPEGGGKFQQNVSMLVDGHTGLEHSLPIPKGYNDLNQLWAATKFGYTPTFVVSFGGLSGEEYFYDRHEIWKNERLLRYTPSFLLDGRSIRRSTAPDNQYNHVSVAKYAKELRDLNVGVHIGAHGQREGLAAHWELWLMEQGGFTPWETLRAGTIDGAKHLGMDKHIGSIEVGKLADLVVINGDVLNDLSRSEFVQYTIINGKIFDVTTMNELNSKKKRAPFFFESNNQLFMPDETTRQIDAKAHLYHWKH